jgi:hypothetical protein
MTKDPKPAGLDSTVTPKKVEPFLWALVLYFRIKQQEDSAKLDDRKAESKAAPRIECLRKPKRDWVVKPNRRYATVKRRECGFNYRASNEIQFLW